jgi:probable phosphoglycerate mutase
LERSKFYKGIHLKKIYPVRNLQLRDFFESRRSFKEYLKDLSKNKISIRSYSFKKNVIKVKKKYLKIDARNRGEFVYHIIKFSIINLNKFLTNKNEDLNQKRFEKLFLKITQNDLNLLKLFRVLKKNKEEKTLIYNSKILNLGKIFLRKYDKFINEIKKNAPKISFTRHAKTSKNSFNTFLGSKLDPDISNKKIFKKKINKKFDLTITSTLKRSKSSAKFFNSKKIISNNLINEINYGDADGMQLRLFKKKYPKIIKSWKKGINVNFPNGESTKDVHKRVKKFLNFLKKVKSKKRILVISHSFFLRVLIGFLLNINLKKIYKLKIDHLKLFEIVKINNKFSSNFDRDEIKKFDKQLYA